MQSESLESWVSVLKRARCFRSEGNGSLLDSFGASLEGWSGQISKYNDFLSKPRVQAGNLGEDEKALIVETRAALRFGLCCLSCENETDRRNLQTRMVECHHWHLPLTTLLSEQRGDSKCRVFAARMFSNLVASNDVTAAVIATAVPLAPSNEDISRSMLGTLSMNGEMQSLYLKKRSNWVSMFISSARGSDREALAGVAAALYNLTVALPTGIQPPFVKRMASDSMLISTLLRQFVSVQAVEAAVDTKVDSNSDSQWDSATDWIFLFLIRLMNMGMLPVMYRAIGGDKAHSSEYAPVFPEQNVLLHCAAREAQSFIDNAAKNTEMENPFGGEVGSEATKASYEFLVDTFCRHSRGSRAADEMDEQLARSAALSCVDVVSISLGTDNQVCADLREHLGSNTELLRTASDVLGGLVDELTERSAGLKARDLKLSPEEQQWMVSLVRLLGNLCYQCRSNQDKIRTTLVPPCKQGSPSLAADSNIERNAIHVLLSCTSFATSCFTLREWGVIAIRNILHENEANQSVVAELDAQDPIQSAALDQAGVRVKMDKSGKVSLSTLDEDKESPLEINNE